MAWSQRDWEKRIRVVASNTSHIAWSDHARHRMQTRQISFAMALDAMQKGIVRLEPEIDIKTGYTKCRMERLIDGRNLGVVVALEGQRASHCVVVTALFIKD